MDTNILYFYLHEIKIFFYYNNMIGSLNSFNNMSNE